MIDENDREPEDIGTIIREYLSGEPVAVVPDSGVMECKFAVESECFDGGSFERNEGGSRTRKRVEFEGHATGELYAALTEAVREVAGR